VARPGDPDRDAQRERQRRKPKRRDQRGAQPAAARGDEVRQREHHDDEDPAQGDDQHSELCIATLLNEMPAGVR